MFDKFDGGIIDYSSVNGIISRLELYLENEEKIISNIQNYLSDMNKYYQSDNSGLLNDKINNLLFSLDTMQKNRREYINYLNNIINVYLNMDIATKNKYQNKGIN